MKLILTLLLLTLSVISFSGCECLKMTDGGSVQQNVESWRLEDSIQSNELMPQLRRYWQTEKAKWPVFVNECKDAEKCYENPDIQ